MPTEKQAVKLMQDIGLTENESRCFVALSRVGQSTAAEISTLSDVPRSRVYDAVERLHRRGLVDVQQSDPREYRAVDREAALETLRRDYRSSIDALDEALANLETVDELETEGAWAISDHKNVTDRMTTLVADAETEVYLIVADEAMLEDAVHEALQDAAERGADVVVEVGSDETRDRVESAVPAATVEVSDIAKRSPVLQGKWLGRIVMVDRDSVVLSAVTDDTLPAQTEETAIWASGADHGLVIGVRQLLSDRLNELETAS